ncbi:embryonic polyadenylate-binding protein 2 [Trichosurus vulpecula]|uniref:embryonic polyadenylate-binding protein 2 n=1 Tax=Trichosurus vulpecula TaxID=9337 RepID=UPI00186AF65F|nr:embryonic polyadenylate-binding protein 2 [Trichosurus vulpecula]
MWFSVGGSNLFPPPSKDWLQNALSDPEGLGWGGEGQPAEKVPKMCQAEEEDKEEESALLSLLDRGNLEEVLGPDLETGVSAHVPQGDGRELEDIKTKLQKIKEAHERQELKGMKETGQWQQPQEEEREAVAEASSPLLSPAPCDNEATHLLNLENGIPFQGVEKLEADYRSVYVGNVDYSGTAEELESLFNCCGEVNRVTILCDKYSGHPKGYAYIEFAYEDSVKTAMDLDETIFRGRIIRVLPKRTNFPGISTTDRGGLRARHSGRGGPLHRYGACIGERSRPRWRSHRGHGRFSQWFEPY